MGDDLAIDDPNLNRRDGDGGAPPRPVVTTRALELQAIEESRDHLAPPVRMVHNPTQRDAPVRMVHNPTQRDAHVPRSPRLETSVDLYRTSSRLPVDTGSRRSPSPAAGSGQRAQRRRRRSPASPPAAGQRKQRRRRRSPVPAATLNRTPTQIYSSPPHRQLGGEEKK